MDQDQIPVLEKLIQKGKKDYLDNTNDELPQKIQAIIDKHSEQMFNEINELLKEDSN